MILTQILPPSTEPVSLAEAKAFCKITHSAEDDTIASLIIAATRQLERYLGVSISEQKWRLELDEFPESIRLPMGPIIQIDAVKFRSETEGALQATDPNLYRLAGTVPQILARNTLVDMPSSSALQSRFAVEYTAGMGDLENGRDLWLAIQFMVQHFHTRGLEGSGVPPIVTSMVQPYRRYS